MPLKTRKVLLGHRNGDITWHYSAPELEELFALEKLILEDLQEGRELVLAGAEGDVTDRLDRLGILEALPRDLVPPTKRAALEKAER